MKIQFWAVWGWKSFGVSVFCGKWTFSMGKGRGNHKNQQQQNHFPTRSSQNCLCLVVNEELVWDLPPTPSAGKLFSLLKPSALPICNRHISYILARWCKFCTIHFQYPWTEPNDRLWVGSGAVLDMCMTSVLSWVGRIDACGHKPFLNKEWSSLSGTSDLSFTFLSTACALI